MENRGRSSPPRGPRPGASERRLSPSRAALLNTLRDQPEPLTLAALVAASSLHENTVREHLDGLRHAGLVRRRRSQPSGRGRPAWLYEATGTDPDVAEYAGLAAALAASIARTSPDPEEVAAAAGEEWGHQLARGRGAAPSSPEQARDEVVALLSDLGFDPQVERDSPSQVRLTRCPLLEAAHRQPVVVCAVHLGLVRGVLAEHGADPDGSRLLPFAEPGACRLVVPPD